MPTPGPTYDRIRRDALIDRYFEKTLTAEESRELSRYIEEDLIRLAGKSESREYWQNLRTFYTALRYYPDLLADEAEWVAKRHALEQRNARA